MKKQSIEFSEQQSLDTCIRHLEALLEGLKAGTVSLSQQEHKLAAIQPSAHSDQPFTAVKAGG